MRNVEYYYYFLLIHYQFPLSFLTLVSFAGLYPLTEMVSTYCLMSLIQITLLLFSSKEALFELFISSFAIAFKKQVSSFVCRQTFVKREIRPL